VPFISTRKIADRYVWLKGCGPQFLSLLPPWPWGG
jgi:hypothetical protein